MKPNDIQHELQHQKTFFSGSGNYILYINTVCYSITIWKISKALQDGKSKLGNNDIQHLSSLQSKPDKFKETDTGIWIGPFNKFEALGFAFHLKQKAYKEESKTFSIDFSKM
jgi:hypothetical protein